MKVAELHKRIEAGEDLLELSIEKWEDILDGTGKEEGQHNCGLCYEYNMGDEACLACPVYKRTKKPRCRETPYKDFKAHLDDCDKCNKGNEGLSLCSEGQELAEEELKFLKSLRNLKEKTEE